jgi:D-tyrosyl-tRNA(Tyr) deacylase
MKAVVQRVASASVTVDDECTGAIDRGLLVYLGIGRDDIDSDLDWLAEKVTGLRIFSDVQGKMALSVQDIGGAILVVSQFTLFGDVRKGKRPNFTMAMPPERAEPMYEDFCKRLEQRKIVVKTGRFRADMRVLSINDGPVTILLDTERSERASLSPRTPNTDFQGDCADAPSSEFTSWSNQAPRAQTRSPLMLSPVNFFFPGVCDGF